MENVMKLLRDIFSMDFDVIIPVSGSIIAVMVGFILFAIRYFTFTRKRKKYEKSQKKSQADTSEIKKNELEFSESEKAGFSMEIPDNMSDDKEVSGQ